MPLSVRSTTRNKSKQTASARVKKPLPSSKNKNKKGYFTKASLTLKNTKHPKGKKGKGSRTKGGFSFKNLFGF